MVKTITLEIGGVAIPVRVPTKELFRLQSIFEEQEYAVADTEPVRTIVDIGANIGLSAMYFKASHPAARVYCFEPCSTSFALLAHNIARLADVQAWQVAVSDFDGQATLKIHAANSGQNSLVGQDANFASSETVPVRDAGALLRELSLTEIDILKVDTEGSELPILRSLAPMLPQVRHILVETHGMQDRLAIEALLHSHELARDRSHAEGFGVLWFRRKG